MFSKVWVGLVDFASGILWGVLWRFALWVLGFCLLRWCVLVVFGWACRRTCGG